MYFPLFLPIWAKTRKFSLYFPVSLFRFLCQRQSKVSIMFCLKLFSPNYFDFCFFKTIPHTITAAKKIKIRYHRLSKQNPLSNINRYPQEAGKIPPMASRILGSKLIGNIIPESIIEGKKTNCAIIVSFAWFFTINPKTLPMLNETIIYITRAKKKNGNCVGKVA